MRSRTARIVVLAAVAVTALVACSDEGSREEFIAAADEVCREADEAIAEVEAPRVDEGVLDYVERARVISAGLVSDLRVLDPPESDQAEVDAMIDDLERATDLLEPLAQASLDRDAGELEELQQEVEQLTEDVGEFAESYGFEVCGARVLDTVR